LGEELGEDLGEELGEDLGEELGEGVYICFLNCVIVADGHSNRCVGKECCGGAGAHELQTGSQFVC
jgi:hypothetical protein